jgi:hypothetical protein
MGAMRVAGRYAGRVCLALLFLGFLGDGLPARPAAAATLPAHGHGCCGNNFGDGRANHNSFIINSPSESSDVQHIRNVNVGGNTVTPAAICKRTRRCKIVQHLVTFDP